jgi:excisionase family DNA binding protein
LRPELQPALALAKTLPPSDLPSFLGAVEEIRVTATARLASPPVAPVEDKLLTVKEAATRLHCSPDYLYRNHKKLPFTRTDKVGAKLLFSSAGLDAYLRGKR